MVEYDVWYESGEKYWAVWTSVRLQPVVPFARIIQLTQQFKYKIYLSPVDEQDTVHRSN